MLTVVALVFIVLVFVILDRAIKGRPVQKYTYADGSSGASDDFQHGCGHNSDGGGHGGCDGGGGH